MMQQIAETWGVGRRAGEVGLSAFQGVCASRNGEEEREREKKEETEIVKRYLNISYQYIIINCSLKVNSVFHYF